MAAAPYPQDIRPLTSLRFVAAFWVLAYHFRDHLSLNLGQIGLVADGWMGVDLFFTLSGFILAHVYLTEFEGMRFRYGHFLQNRLARIYPLHLVALGAMIALYAAASITGAGVGDPAAFKWTDLPQHLLLIHAWGMTEAVGWNFPSWSISAEWAAYLAFPLIAAAVLSHKSRPGIALAIALALCLANYVLLDRLHLYVDGVGQGFEQMTAQIGALRIIPSFLMGVALYAFGRARPIPVRFAWPLVLTSAYWTVLVVTLNWWEGLAWFGLAGLILGLAETARTQSDAPMAGKNFVFLGAASYALYMLHLPIDIVWFHGLEKLGVTDESALMVRIAAVAGVFIACTTAAALAYIFIEEPARKWVRKLKLPQLPKTMLARQP
ncbi:MAG: acyltransferase [Caulobacterales bacterium]